jgi:hypothetical protein
MTNRNDYQPQTFPTAHDPSLKGRDIIPRLQFSAPDSAKIKYQLRERLLMAGKILQENENA